MGRRPGKLARIRLAARPSVLVDGQKSGEAQGPVTVWTTKLAHPEALEKALAHVEGQLAPALHRVRDAGKD